MWESTLDDLHQIILDDLPHALNKCLAQKKRNMLFSCDDNVIIYDDIGSLSQAAAEIFSQTAYHSVNEKKRMLVALSGGSTPNLLFQLLSGPQFAQSLPWEWIHFFWCDERLVAPDHPESNFGQAFEKLFSRVNIPEKNLHRIQGELGSSLAVDQYQKLLGSFGDDSQLWPRFDLVFLGLGSDGHIASLFPGAMTPEDAHKPVITATSDYQGRPAERITLTPLVINNARKVVFMVSGKNKSQAVKMSLNRHANPYQWPALLIRPENGEIIWMLDNDAASG